MTWKSTIILAVTLAATSEAVRTKLNAYEATPNQTAEPVDVSDDSTPATDSTETESNTKEETSADPVVATPAEPEPVCG